jgi:hypothetical protein
MHTNIVFILSALVVRRYALKCVSNVAHYLLHHMLQNTTAGSTRQSNRAFQQLTPPGEVPVLFGAVL